MEQHPDIGIVASGAGVGAYIAGDYERAVQLAERGAQQDGSTVALIMLAQAYGYAGQKEKVLPLLEKAASAGTYVCPYESAAAYLSIGDDRACHDVCSMRPSPTVRTVSCFCATIRGCNLCGSTRISRSC